jgi:hypothetical protein
MRPYLEHLNAAVTSWQGISANPHRFGGIEYNLGTTEVGHVHQNGMVDIPFNSKIRDQLILERKAEPHHLLKDTGWISFYIRSEADVETAIWLFRLSYLFNASRGRNRTALGDGLNLSGELAALQASQPMQTILDGLIVRR